MAKNAIGQFIAALRKANGMTQQDVADRLNVSNKAVSRWERDECAPDLSVIPTLAEMFGVTCDELLRGERITNTESPEKKEKRMEKQVKTLVNRTLSGFKTLIWISLAVAVVGLVCMFGISYGFYRPVIGFSVMLLFEACALVATVLAVSRTKDIKRDNELFEMADESLVSRFNNTLGTLSFLAFYVIFAVVVLSLPLILITSDYVNSVVTPYSYFTVFLGGLVLILALVYLKCRDPYLAWVSSGKIPEKPNDDISKARRKMSMVQIVPTILAGVLFVIAPYFDYNPHETTFLYTALVLIGLACLLVNI
ncbi:MAG: helix-turn-helix transcriptional regulator, partial [Bacteroidaceae bacterium]|nr:helix-turn-helix transcriptional regulator [Bacteroidaceae bacterium]